MDLSIIGTILGLMVTRGNDINKIEQSLGGIPGLVAVGGELQTLWQLYRSGGINAVLEKGGPDVQAIIEKIGPANIAAVMPPAGNLLAAWQKQGGAPS